MMIPVIILVAGFLVFTISHTWKNYPQDNAIEEIVEDVIKVETGVDVDLTPQSPENKDVLVGV